MTMAPAPGRNYSQRGMSWIRTASLVLASMHLFCPAAGGVPDGSPAARVTYRLVPLSSGPRALRAKYGDSQLLILEKLNRRDLDHLVRLGMMVAPDTLVDDELACSPMPRGYAWGDSLPKLLVVDQPAQAFGAYERGRLVRWGPVATGRAGDETPTGLFHLTWKSKARHSTVDSTWYLPWYFNFGNREGVSIHQYELPGRPASHSCVRLLAPDAEWLYGWGEQWRLGPSPWIVLKEGTPLLIIGRCDYDAPAPWRSLKWLAHGVELPADPPTRQDWSAAGAPE